MSATAGVIVTVNIVAPKVVNATACYLMGEPCIINLLCKATECIVTNGSILINWIW